MGAPLGNRFWELAEVQGRKTEFTPKELWQKAIDYFKWCDENPWIKLEQLRKPTVTIDNEGNEVLHTIAEIPTQRPYTIAGFCIFCECSRDWWNKLRDNKNNEFFRVIARIDDIIYNQKFEGAAVGAFNANIISRDLGLTDKKEINLPSKIKIKFNRPDSEDGN